MNPSAYWCCHSRSTQFFNLYILFSSPFSSPSPAPVQWVLAFSEHVIFSYSFFKKKFYTTYLQTKHIQRKKHSCCAMERGKCRWEWKSGGRDTHSHTIICLVLFFWFCIDSKARARENGESIAESNRRFSRFSFSFFLLALPFFYLIFERWCVLLSSYIYVYLAYFFLPLERKKAREGKEIECDNSNIFQLKKKIFSPATCFSPKTLARTDDYPERRSNLDLLYVACVLRTRVQYVCYVD